MNHVEVEVGRVLETRPGRARVEVTPGGICSHCEMSSSCMPASGGNRIIDVADPIGVSPGLRVRIELAAGRMVMASLLAYMVPLAGLFAGALTGFYSAARSSAELWGGVGAAAGLAVGFLVSRLLGERLASLGKLTPAITAVIADEDREERENGD